jgi:hypothetical protein
MSQGLGKMQRDILDHLEPGKRAHAAGDFAYAGGMTYQNFWQQHRRANSPPTIRTKGRVHTLPDGVYDLRATLVSVALARREAHRNEERMSGWWVFPRKLNSAFSRAVRGLIARGLLERQDTGREIRFVRRAAPPQPAG